MFGLVETLVYFSFWKSTYPVKDVALATYKSPILYLDDEQK